MLLLEEDFAPGLSLIRDSVECQDGEDFITYSLIVVREIPSAASCMITSQLPSRYATLQQKASSLLGEQSVTKLQFVSLFAFKNRRLIPEHSEFHVKLFLYIP